MKSEPELIETRLEERDGAMWVSGICSYCWERMAFRAPRPGSLVQCPHGHPLRIEELHSEGLSGRATLSD